MDKLSAVPREHFLKALLRPHVTDARLCVDGWHNPLASRVEIAFDAASRTRGLLGRDGLEPASALIIAPCYAIHTFRMRFSIDVIFAAADGRVLKLREAMPAGRLSASVGAFAVIEMAAGSIAGAALQVGHRLTIATG